MLKDPPIAAHHNGCFIILDGATRTQAMKELGAAQIAIQVVHYQEPIVRLDTWTHLLMEVPDQEVCERVQTAANMRGHPIEPEMLHEGLATGRFSFGFCSDDGTAIGFNCSNDHRHRIAQLNRVVEACQGLSNIYRTDINDLSILKARYSNLSVVIFYPIFRPMDIVQCVLNEVEMPAGITRHLIDGRVLELNLPLDMLTAPGSLDDNNRRLRDQVEGGSFKKTHAQNGEILLLFKPKPVSDEPQDYTLFNQVDELIAK
jgi:hypothetical protein